MSPKKLLSISDIEIPSRFKTNPAGLQAEESNHDYASSIGLFDIIPKAKFYACSSLTKYAYPTASLERLVACGQFIEWLFIIDDQFDEDKELVANREMAVALAENYMKVFRTGERTKSPNAATQLSLSLREKLLRLGSEEWFEALCHGIEQYLQIGVLGAMDSWRSGAPQELEKYMLDREHDAGVYPCLDMVEIAAGFDLPKSLREDLEIQDMRKLTTRHVAFANDLFSYDKEVPKHSNPNNLVFLLMHWKGLNFDQAVNEVVEILNADMKTFQELKLKVGKRNCPSAGMLALYIDGMEHWMGGNVDWSLQTGRYNVGKKAS